MKSTPKNTALQRTPQKRRLETMPNFAKCRSKAMMELTRKLEVAAVRKKRSKSKSPVGPMFRSAKEAKPAPSSPRLKFCSWPFRPEIMYARSISFYTRDCRELRVCDNLRLATTTVGMTQRSCTQRSQTP